MYIMKLFIIFATMVVYIRAAPIDQLLHPSPVNPDVLVAIKPEEKITLMTDPEEIVKFKSETKQTFYPTMPPKDSEQRKIKHDLNAGHLEIPKTQEPTAVGKLVQKSQNRNTSIKLSTRKRRNVESYQNPTKTEGLAKILTPPIILKLTTPGTEKQKRDIPVPLVPKYHHPEESPKDINENNKEISSESHHIPQTKVNEEKSLLQPLPGISKETRDLSEQIKRNTSISSVPNRDSATNLSPDKEIKGTQTENHHLAQVHNVAQNQGHQHEGKDMQHHDVKTYHTTQTLTSHNHEHLDVEELQKPQSIPAHNPQALPIPQQHNYPEELDKKTQTDISKKEKGVEEIKPIYHIPVIQKDLKPNMSSDQLSVQDFTTSTTEHPIIRRRLVPVAELFSK